MEQLTVLVCSLNDRVESLAAYFRNFGEIREAIVMRTSSGQSRGFGFCVFQDAQVCEAVLANKNHIIDNRRVWDCFD